MLEVGRGGGEGGCGLWHLGEELRDLGAPRANPVIHLARISQKQPNIFSPTAQQDLLFTAQKCQKIRLGVCSC